MKMEIKYRLLRVISVALVVLGVQSVLVAQDFEVAPVVLDFKVEPGMQETKKITIRNHSPKGQAFLLSTKDFYWDSLGNKTHTPPEGQEGTRSIKDWVSIVPSFIELNPNQSIEVNVTMRVPSKQYGTRWGNIVVQAVEEQIALQVDKSVSTGIMVKPRISVIVSQSPKSNKNYKGIVQSFTNTNGIEYKMVAENVGDKILKAKVYFLLANVETGEEQKLQEQKVTIYPTGRKDVYFFMPKNLPDGTYALAAILDVGHGVPLEGAQILVNIGQ